MNKLKSDDPAVLDCLDDEMHELYDDAFYELQRGDVEERARASIVVDLITRLARALAPQPCGHPGACVVSSDEGTHYCGLCEAIAAVETAIENQQLSAMEKWAVEIERDALREKLAAAEELATVLGNVEWKTWEGPSGWHSHLTRGNEKAIRQALAAWEEANGEPTDN